MKQTIIAQGINDHVTFESHLRELLNDCNVVNSKALVAFVTLNGVLSIGAAPGGELFNHIRKDNNTFQWIIGIDSITTSDALRTLRELEGLSTGEYYVRVFESSSGIFHPKVFIFKRIDGSGTVLIGSNNLTSGGLKDNIEVAVRLDNLTADEINQWEELWESINNKKDNVKLITDELLTQLQETRRRERTNRQRVQRHPAEETVIKDITIPEVEPLANERKILIREVPRAGDRVHQVHFTLDIAEHYFGFTEEGGSKQIRLQQLQPNSFPGEVEHRRLVLSPVNRNAKIEVGGARILLENYPDEARPILVFEQLESDFFRYMLLLPGDKGFDELSTYLATLPRRKSLPYKITDLNEMLEIWPDYPV